MTVTEWKHWQEYKKAKVRNHLTQLVTNSPDKELNHELIEQAIIYAEPTLQTLGVENDEFHELITTIYLEYHKSGAVD